MIRPTARGRTSARRRRRSTRMQHRMLKPTFLENGALGIGPSALNALRNSTLIRSIPEFPALKGYPMFVARLAPLW